MTRTKDFSRKNTQNDSASAIDNTKKSGRNILAIAAASTLIVGLAPFTMVHASAEDEGFVSIVDICTVGVSQEEPCLSDDGSSANDGRHGFELDVNPNSQKQLAGYKITWAGDPNVSGGRIFTIKDAEGNFLGTIAYKNGGDKNYSFNLEEGVSVLIRKQDENVYSYIEISGQGEFHAESNSAWIKGVKIDTPEDEDEPGGGSGDPLEFCTIEGLGHLMADDPLCATAPDTGFFSGDAGAVSATFGLATALSTAGVALTSKMRKAQKQD